MSVTTTADEYRYRASKALKAADEALAEFVLEAFARECWGHDEYRNGYEQDVREALRALQEIREKIG